MPRDLRGGANPPQKVRCHLKDSHSRQSATNQGDPQALCCRPGCLQRIACWPLHEDPLSSLDVTLISPLHSGCELPEATQRMQHKLFQKQREETGTLGTHSLKIALCHSSSHSGRGHDNQKIEDHSAEVEDDRAEAHSSQLCSAQTSHKCCKQIVSLVMILLAQCCSIQHGQRPSCRSQHAYEHERQAVGGTHLCQQGS